MEDVCPSVTLRLVMISDTHDRHPKDIPMGDVLIHAGDFCCGDTLESLRRDIAWMSSLPHRWKLVCMGNHDLALKHLLQTRPEVAHDLFKTANIHLLKDAGITINGVRFYGINWGSSTVPVGTDILISHIPPFGILDNPDGQPGSKELLRAVQRAQPQVHLFGHVHGSRGHREINGTHFYNAAQAAGVRPWIHEIPIGE